jgi:hypothetical protein
MARLTINFYDVGHGNCTHIITPMGTYGKELRKVITFF